MKKYFYLIAAILMLICGLSLVATDSNSITVQNVIGLIFILLACFSAFRFVTLILSAKDCVKITEGLGNGTGLYKKP